MTAIFAVVLEVLGRPTTVYRGLAQWDRNANWLVPYHNVFESGWAVEDQVLPNTAGWFPLSRVRRWPILDILSFFGSVT